MRHLAWLVLVVLLAGCGDRDWGPDQEGRTVDAQRLAGRWLLVNYWAEWCGPCRTEIPELNDLAATQPELVVLGVNFDGLQGEELRRAAAALGIRFTVLAQDPAERLGVAVPAVLPSSLLIDPEGVVRAELVGEQTARGILERLAQLR